MCDIEPPESLLEPMCIPSKLLMGPGPSNCSSSILVASSQQMLGHLDEDFLKIMEDVKKGIQYAFQTRNRMTFAVSGTGHCAMETAIINVLEPGDTILTASSEIWDDRVKNIAQRIGVQCVQMSSQANSAIDLKRLEEVVSRVKPNVVYICHGDSSTGVVQPLFGISNILKKHGCLLLVDAVASLGATPIFMDRQGIDILYCGSQKVLNAPPGLSPISFSSKAVERIKARKTPVTSFYMDCLLIGNYWNCDDCPIVYHHTAPMSLVYALRTALSILAKETLIKSWKRHKLWAEVLYQELHHLGLDLFVPQMAHRLTSVTTVKIPPQIDGMEVVQSMRQRFHVDIAGGLGSTSGKVWRIGLMGCNARVETVTETIQALKSCIGPFILHNKL